MKKTSIYIEDEVDVALTRRAQSEGRTKADIIRDALRAATTGAVRVKPRSIGVFDGPGDLSERFDDHLAASGFGET